MITSEFLQAEVNQDLIDEVKEFTERNEHTIALYTIAKHFNLKGAVKRLNEICGEQLRLGYIPEAMYQERYKMQKSALTLIGRHHGQEVVARLRGAL